MEEVVVVRTNCGCLSRLIYAQEHIDAKISRSSSEVILKKPTEDLCNLKRKVISDICGILKKLECGTQPDLELILEEISLIEISIDENGTTNFY